jgi:predicted nucleotidyltransferase
MSTDLSLPQEYKRRVESAFGLRVAKMVLFGSRARGDMHEESDWDIAVFFTDEPSMEDRHRLVDLGADVLFDTGQVIQPITLPLRRHGEESYLMRAIRADGITL